MKNSWKNFKLW